jgi:hypothetical protein
MEIDMSAFIVNNNTIHRCLMGLCYAKLSFEYNKELGQKLLELNARAVAQRYEEPEEKVVFKGSKFPVSPIGAVKALHCLRYQCSEGDVPQDPLFKKISRAIEILSEDIVCNLPQWNEEPWDG